MTGGAGLIGASLLDARAENETHPLHLLTAARDEKMERFAACASSEEYRNAMSAPKVIFQAIQRGAHSTRRRAEN